MINNVDNNKKSIIVVLFWKNLSFLIISIFYFNKALTLLVLAINFILLGSYLILEKYGLVIDGLIKARKIAKGLNSKLGEL